MRIAAALVLVTALVAACGDNNVVDPCFATQCPLPAPPTCNGDTVVVTADGVCADVAGAASCSYATTTTDCTATGQVCANGGCHAPTDPCVGTTCATPPEAQCDGNTLDTYDATGTCDSSSGQPVCSYAMHTTDCTASGDICSGGECVNPCDGDTCNTPPTGSCSGTVLTTYGATGTCDGSTGTGICTYQKTTTDCATTDQVCDPSSLACVDPCSLAACDTPPAASCDASGVLTTYASPGTCDGSTGTAQCTYAPSTTDCTSLDQACDATDGVCADPCAGVACTTPPGPSCAADGFTLTTYGATGTCSATGGVAGCTYAPTMTDCSTTDQACANGACVDPCLGTVCAPQAATCAQNVLTTYSAGTCSATDGVATCDYTPAMTDCTTTGQVCDAPSASCVDTCGGATCDTPPDATCSGNTLTSYANPGTCDTSGETPVCTYAPATTDCTLTDQACVNGACVDPCIGMTCTTPPAATCGGASGNVAETFGATGSCVATAGVPGCTYPETDQDCSFTGQTCAAGACTGPVLFVRTQFPTTITAAPDTSETVYGRVYIPGVTDQSGVDDPVGANVKIQFGFGTGGDPSTFTWADATQNASYGPGSPGYEPNNDEYMYTFAVPEDPGTPYFYGYRLSNDGGTTWVYGDTGDAGSTDGWNAPGTLTITGAPFFSEYIEGSSNDKALEIYNPLGTAFSLSGCSIQIFANGGTTGQTAIAVTGTSIASHGTYVVCNTSYTAAVGAGQCQQTSGSYNWNGNDAIVFSCGGTILDSFGQVGNDPGATGWGGITADHTLIRDCTIWSGDATTTDAFDPTVQWATYVKDSDFLGARNCPLPSM